MQTSTWQWTCTLKRNVLNNTWVSVESSLQCVYMFSADISCVWLVISWGSYFHVSHKQNCKRQVMSNGYWLLSRSVALICSYCSSQLGNWSTTVSAEADKPSPHFIPTLCFRLTWTHLANQNWLLWLSARQVTGGHSTVEPPWADTPRSGHTP